MTQQTAVEHFENIVAVLLYVACSGSPVNSKELQENVCEVGKGMMNLQLKRLVQNGWLVSNGKQTTRAYIASEKTKELFGLMHDSVDDIDHSTPQVIIDAERKATGAVK